MFGGVCFMAYGKLCVGTWKGSLVVRLDEAQRGETLAEPRTKPFDITGCVIEGMGIGRVGRHRIRRRDPRASVGRAAKVARSLPAR